jgi:hypothetical protein
MPRRKPAEAEVLPPEEEPKKTRRQVVEAKHTVTYAAPEVVEVPIEEEIEEDGALYFEGEPQERRPRRKTAKDERDDLRKKFRDAGVAPASQLKISIDKYQHSDSPGGGVWADTEHCTKYACTLEHILNEDYLGVAQKWGPGLYRITVRKENRIVDAWDKRVIGPSAPLAPSAPGEVAPAMYAQAIPPADPFKDAEKAFALVERMRKMFPEQQEAKSEIDPEVAALTLLAKNPAVMEKIGTGLAGLISGGKGGYEEPSWGAVAMELIKSGQAAEVARVTIQTIFGSIGGMVGGNNGQATMGAQALPNQTPGNMGRMEAPALPQAGTEGATGVVSNVSPQSPADRALSEILNFTIQQCQARTDAAVVLDSISAHIADEVPTLFQNTVWAQLDAVAEMEPDAVLAFVKTLPGGEAVANLEHAQPWLERLQKAIRDMPKEEGEA